MSRNPDPQQLAAATAFKGAFRVDACAGAGKTTTLVARLAFLKKQGIPECDILALTFTKNAAEEMRTRAGAEKETLRTLHSWALATVKREVDEFVPRLRPFPLLTSQFELVVPLAKQSGLQYKDLTSYISNAKRRGKTPQDMAAESENDIQDRLAQAYQQYQDACRRMGVLDFDSIIWELVLLFDRKPAVCDRNQIPYLMVDEAQDCSEMDWRLIRQITRRHGNVWIVGDFAQSVYSFRGASPQIFAAFDSLFPGARTLPMGTNYRSQANIVTYSQKVMPEQTSYLSDWKAHKPATTDPVFLKFDNEVDEARWVLNQITSGKIEINETAILARTNAQLAILQGFCAERQIAYKLLGKDNFWKRPEVLALIGLAKNVDGYDDLAMKSVIRSPLPCVKYLRKDDCIAELERMQSGRPNMSNGDPVPFKQLLSSYYTGNSRADELMHDLGRILVEAKKRETSPFGLLDYLAVKSGAAELGNDDDGDTENFVKDNVRKVVNLAKSFSTLKEFLNFVRTAGRPSRKQTRLILATVHGFKGKEAKNIFVIGVNLGVFPHDRSDLQEEKRLYYVAVSRPTDNLWVSCSGAPSDFLKDLVPVESVEVPAIAAAPPVPTVEDMPLFQFGG